MLILALALAVVVVGGGVGVVVIVVDITVAFPRRSVSTRRSHGACMAGRQARFSKERTGFHGRGHRILQRSQFAPGRTA